MIDEKQFGKGAIKSTRDKRDFKWEKIGSASSLFDWSVGFETIKPLKIKNQGQSLSCGGQAVSYYGEILNAVSDKTQEEKSAKFIYSNVFSQGGGSWGRDLFKWVKDYGWGMESSTPSYENGNPPTEQFMTRKSDITESALAEAKKERAFSYVTIETGNIDSVAQAIRDNNGALIGVNGANNGSWTSKFPQPPMNYTWRHWILGVGAVLINGKKYIKIVNSWGNVGENGFQYLGEEWFTTGNIFEAWTCVYNTDKPEIGFKYRFTQDMQRGSFGDDVKALQAVLRLEGLFKYPSNTGTYGVVTQDAIYQFQIKYNLAPYSRWLYKGFYCGPATRQKLNELYSP